MISGQKPCGSPCGNALEGFPAQRSFPAIQEMNAIRLHQADPHLPVSGEPVLPRASGSGAASAGDRSQQMPVRMLVPRGKR